MQFVNLTVSLLRAIKSLGVASFESVSKSVASGHATITLTPVEQLATKMALTGTPDAAVPVEAVPMDGKVFCVLNGMTGQGLTIRASGQTGVTVAAGKSAIVMGNGTDFVRVTTDA
jgi:hypothetical protein